MIQPLSQASTAAIQKSVEASTAYIPIDSTEPISSLTWTEDQIWEAQILHSPKTASTAQVVYLNNNVRSKTAADIIKSLDHELNLPRNTLANLLGVARTTLYDFLNDKAEDRKFTNEVRLSKLEQALDAIKSCKLGFPVGKSAMILKNQDGKTLVDELNNNDINLENIKALAKLIAERKSDSYQASKFYNRDDLTEKTFSSSAD